VLTWDNAALQGAKIVKLSALDRQPIEIADPSTWPTALRRLVRKVAAEESDDLSDLMWGNRDDEFHDAVDAAPIRAYHCTRLTERECTDIQRDGLEVLSPALVARRIVNAVEDGQLTPDEGALYATSKRSRDENRRGLVHLVGDRSSLDDPHQVGHLLSIWGGEGLNMHWHSRSHECRRLELVGTPSVVVAVIEASFVSRAHPGWLLAAASGVLGEPRGLALTCRAPIPGSRIEMIHQPGSGWWDRFVRWEP